MPAVTAALSRRLVLRGLAATTLAPAALGAEPLAGLAQPDAVLIGVADLHSPYRHLPRLLAAGRALRARFHGAPAAFIVNGDVFERGNVAALRSAGAADWAFLAALAAEGPTVLNLGNHEAALEDDLATVVARAEALGVQTIGSVLDARSGRPYAPASARLGLGGRRVGLLGLAPDDPFVWRAPHRAAISLPDPVAFARDAAPGAFAGADFPVLLSHAGIAADKRLLAGLPAGAAVIGGHDHLRLSHAAPGLGYAHGGAWGTHLTLTALRAGVAPEVRPIASADLAEAPDPALAAAVDAVLTQHLTDADREVIAEIPQSLDLHASILHAAEAVRAAAEADVAMLGHTTFGQPLAAGPLSRFDFDAFVRFDGAVVVAELDGAMLAAMLSRANQHRATTLDARTGAFAHATALDLAPGATYRVAVNDWLGRNQQVHFGLEGLAFTPLGGPGLKALVAAALAARP